MIDPSILDAGGRIAYSDIPLWMRWLLLQDLLRREPWRGVSVGCYFESLMMEHEAIQLTSGEPTTPPWELPLWSVN